MTAGNSGEGFKDRDCPKKHVQTEGSRKVIPCSSTFQCSPSKIKILTTGSRFLLEMNSLIDREVEIFQGRGPRRRQHLPSSLASKPLAHIPLQEPFQKGLQLGRKGIRELHVLQKKETQRDYSTILSLDGVCKQLSHV